MKKIIIAIILLNITVFNPLPVISQETDHAAEKKELEAKYIFDLRRSSNFREIKAAIAYLFTAQRYEELKNQLDKASDGRVRNIIIQKLGTLKDIDYLDMFVRYLDPQLTSFWETRLTAVEAISNYHVDTAIPYLLEAAEHDPHWQVKAKAAVTMARIGTKENMNRVIEMFIHPQNEEAEYQLALALGSIDTPLSSAALFEGWNSKQQRVVTAITYIMGIRNYPDAFPLIIDKLNALDFEERKAAHFSLAIYKKEDPRTLPALRKALQDENDQIRKLVIFGLTLHNDTNSITQLQQIFDDPKIQPTIKSVCLPALKHLGVIGQVNVVRDNQLIVSVGGRYGLDRRMLGQVISIDPYLEIGSWKILTLNSTQSVLSGPKELLAAIKENKDNYQVIFLFPPGDYPGEIYLKLDLPPWVRELLEVKGYAFTG